jgi:hypothetical protein
MTKNGPQYLIATSFKRNPLPWFVTIFGLVGAIYNVWLASQLTPFAIADDQIVRRVEAVETRQNTFMSKDELIARFESINTQLNDIKTTINKNH